MGVAALEYNREVIVGQRSTEVAQRFESAVAEFETAVQAVPDDKWNAECEAPWTTAQVAAHIAGQFPLESEIFMPAADGDKALSAFTWAEVNGRNDARAAAEANATKDDVLKTIRDGARPIAAYIRGLTDEQLDRKSPLSLADGAEVTTQQLLEGGVLIDHVGGGHLASIKAMAGAPVGR